LYLEEDEMDLFLGEEKNISQKVDLGEVMDEMEDQYIYKLIIT
jgi:hypothetical protein